MSLARETPMMRPAYHLVHLHPPFRSFQYYREEKTSINSKGPRLDEASKVRHSIVHTGSVILTSRGVSYKNWLLRAGIRIIVFLRYQPWSSSGVKNHVPVEPARGTHDIEVSEKKHVTPFGHTSSDEKRGCKLHAVLGLQ